MVTSSNKRMKDLLTDEDISNVLDNEDESDIFSEESDDFWFDTSEEDSESDSDTSSVVHESEPIEEVSDFSQRFVPHGVARPRFAFLGVSGVNVDFDDEIKVLECFQKFIDEDMWQLFAEQTNIYANQFLAANPNLKPRSPDMVPGTSKKKPTRRCVICWANGKRKESSYLCSNCEKARCVVPCFQVYHTDKNLKI